MPLLSTFFLEGSPLVFLVFLASRCAIRCSDREIRDFLISPTVPNGREFPVSSWDKNLPSHLIAAAPKSALQNDFKYSSRGVMLSHFWLNRGFSRHRCISGRYVDKRGAVVHEAPLLIVWLLVGCCIFTNLDS